MNDLQDKIRRKYKITNAEYCILVILSKKDCSIKSIANLIHLSRNTVNHHMASLKEKLGVKQNTILIVKAHQIGLINIDHECKQLDLFEDSRRIDYGKKARILLG